MRPLKRPRLFVTALAAVAGLVAGAAWQVADVGRDLAARPLIVAVEADALAAALEDAPALSTGTGPLALWLLTEPDCPRCRSLEARLLPRLDQARLSAAMVVSAPRDAASERVEAQASAAALDADWDAFQPCLRDGACGDRLAPGSPAQEGYLEWGRASRDRIAAAIAANGAELKAPALFWRAGREWRALIDPEPRGLTHFWRDQGA